MLRRGLEDPFAQQFLLLSETGGSSCADADAVSSVLRCFLSEAHVHVAAH